MQQIKATYALIFKNLHRMWQDIKYRPNVFLDKKGAHQIALNFENA